MIGTKVLIVDDAPAILDALSQILERLGVGKDRIVRAESGAAALKSFRADPPSVVFMDMNLGTEESDKAALEMLTSGAGAKLILMTGMDTADPRVRALVSAGAYEVLEKPLRLVRLRQVMELIDTEERGLRRI